MTNNITNQARVSQSNIICNDVRQQATLQAWVEEIALTDDLREYDYILEIAAELLKYCAQVIVQVEYWRARFFATEIKSRDVLTGEKAISGSVARGWLVPYFKNKRLKDGSIASYPRVNGTRERDNIEDWYWDYCWWERKTDGGWRQRKRYVPPNLVLTAQYAIAKQLPITEILGLLSFAASKGGVL